MHPLFQYGILNNRWLWFHILGAAVLARLFLYFGYTDQHAFGLVLMIALLWEVIEYFWKMEIKKNLLSTYGSEKRFFLDAFGDIAGAVIISLIILI